MVLAGQPSRIAEEVDVVRVDIGAVPVSAVQHDGKKLMRKGVATVKPRPRGGEAAG